MDDISDYVRVNTVLSDVTNVTSTELDILDGATITTTELNILDGLTATTTELNILDGATLTTTELNYVDGVTSSIQTQLDGKESTITGAATTITSTDLTTGRVLVSDTNGKVAVSDVTSTELAYLDGVTSAIQTQIDGLTEFEPANTGSANQVLTRTSTGYQWSDAADASYTLEAATSSTLGGVIVEDSSDIVLGTDGKLTLGNLSANKITSGVLGTARIPDITNSKIDSGSATDGYVLTADGSGGAAWESAGGGSGGHDIVDPEGNTETSRGKLKFASPLTVTDDGATDDQITVDISLAVTDLPNLPTSKVTSGVFNSARLSTDTPTDQQVLTYRTSDNTMHWTHKGSATVAFGTDGGEVSTWAEGDNTDSLPTSKIPDLSATKITSGTLSVGRLSSDTPSTNDVLKYDGTNAVWAAEDNSVDADEVGAGTLGDDVLVGDQNSTGGFKFWYGTQADYEALVTADTLDDDTIYMTDSGGLAGSGTVTNIATGTGLSGGPITSTGTINLNLSALTDGTEDIVGSTDEIIYLDNGTQKRKQVNEWKLSQFNNELSSSVTILGTDAGETGPVLEFYHDSDSPADDDEVGRIEFAGESTNGTKKTYATITAYREAAIDGQLIMTVFDGNTEDTAFDYHAGDGSIGIGTAAPGAAQIQIGNFAGQTLVSSGDIQVGKTGDPRSLYIGGTADANELDDYEEGTWTPDALNLVATDSSTDFTSANGNYTKVGNKVHCVVRIQVPANSDTSTVRFTLPFTIDTNIYNSAGFPLGTFSTQDALGPIGSVQVHSFGTSVYLDKYVSEGDGNNLTETDCDYSDVSGDYIELTFTYFTTQ